MRPFSRIIWVIICGVVLVYMLWVGQMSRFNVHAVHGAAENQAQWDVPPAHTSSRPKSVHICMVSCGNNYQQMVTMLKSLLATRSVAIFAHFVVDAETRIALQTIIAEWQVPYFSAQFYNVSRFLHLTAKYADRSRKVKHMSGHYRCAFAKLILSHILRDVDNVIYLDGDTLFLHDIYRLWSYFGRFKANQYIGMAGEQSGWYMDKSGSGGEGTYKWPVVPKSKGFNSGVMLMNLTRMREAKWVQLWTDSTQSYLEQTGHDIQLADQDIFNLIVQLHEHILFQLPCGWNVQLNGDLHCMDALHIVHGNNFKWVKEASTNSEFYYFEQAYRTMDPRWLTHFKPS